MFNLTSHRIQKIEVLNYNLVEQYSHFSLLDLCAQDLMKTGKNISYHDIPSVEQTHQIKCYLKLYHPNGVSSPQAHPPSNYEILDQNTLLRKKMIKNKEQYEMYPYTRIFSARIGNQLMSKHVCFADDLQEGINHTMISLVDQSTKRLFTTGSIEQHGIFLQYFLTLFEDFQNKHYQNKTSQVYLTMFATVNCKANQYIDLINGQRYTYLSKKDVDSASYKTFHELKVNSIQQFLIGLKIAAVRYHQCCNDDDFIVFRLTTLNDDEFNDKKTTATGNVIVCHQANKNTQLFLKQTQTLINYSSPSGQPYQVKDHGSLFSCIEPYLRNGKVSIIQCMLNEYQKIQANLSEIKRIPSLFLNKTCTYKVNKQQIPLEKFLINYQQKIPALMNIHKADLHTVHNLNTKELQKFAQIFSCYKQFIKDSTDKLQQFAKLYKQVLETRNQFYEKERFPVSLQIKPCEDVNLIIKSYYISKMYSLSEKFQMASLESPSEKMTTLKHQIFLSLKSLSAMLEKKNAKKQLDTTEVDQNNQNTFSLNSSTYPTGVNHEYGASNKDKNQSIENNNDKSSQKYEKLMKVMKVQLETIRKNIKYILYIDSKKLMQEIKENNQNGQEGRQKKKSTKFKQKKEIKFILDSVDFGQLLGPELIGELDKLLKNLINKRQISNAERKNQRESVDFLVGPAINNKSVIDCIKDSNENSLHLSKKNSINKNQRRESSLQQKNNRIIVFKENKTKIISYYEKNTEPQQAHNATQKRMKKLMSEPQTLQQSLLLVKRQQLSKHLQIRKQLQTFSNESRLLEKTNNQLGNSCASYNAKSKQKNKQKVQTEEENENTHVTQVSTEILKNKEKVGQNAEKYQLIHQKAIRKIYECEANKKEQKLDISQLQVLTHNQNQQNSRQLKKRSKANEENKQNSNSEGPNLQRNSILSMKNGQKIPKQSQKTSSLHPINHEKNSITIGLPEIKKSLDIDTNDRKMILHSPRPKKNQQMRIVNNSIIDESCIEQKHKKRFDSEGNKSFLPQIGLIGKKIAG